MPPSRILSSSVATVLGVGKIKPASGTWGTLAAVPLALLIMPLPFLHMLICLVLFFVAVWASHEHSIFLNQKDPSEIVIDEYLGYLITMVWLPLSWKTILLGFVLFRLLDIFKPSLIGWIDKKSKGGFGIVADDVIAGIIANIFMQVIVTYYS